MSGSPAQSICNLCKETNSFSMYPISTTGNLQLVYQLYDQNVSPIELLQCHIKIQDELLNVLS